MFGKNRLTTLSSGCTFTILGGKRQSRRPPIYPGRREETYITHDLFSNSLDNILASLCTNSGEYNTHSFRIGAATSASEAGIPDSIIMMLGSWQSNAYQRYIKTAPEKLAQLSQTLATGGYASQK